MGQTEADTMHIFRYALMTGQCSFYGLAEDEQDEFLKFVSGLDSPLDTDRKTTFPDYAIQGQYARGEVYIPFGGFVEIFDTSADIYVGKTEDKNGVNQHKHEGMFNADLDKIRKSKSCNDIVSVFRTYPSADSPDAYREHFKSKYKHHMNSFKDSEFVDVPSWVKHKCFMIHMLSSLRVLSDEFENRDKDEYHLIYDSDLLHYIYDNSDGLDYIIYISPHVKSISYDKDIPFLAVENLTYKAEIIKISSIPTLPAYSDFKKYVIYGCGGNDMHHSIVI